MKVQGRCPSHDSAREVPGDDPCVATLHQDADLYLEGSERMRSAASCCISSTARRIEVDESRMWKSADDVMPKGRFEMTLNLPPTACTTRTISKHT